MSHGRSLQVDQAQCRTKLRQYSVSSLECCLPGTPSVRAGEATNRPYAAQVARKSGLIRTHPDATTDSCARAGVSGGRPAKRGQQTIPTWVAEIPNCRLLAQAVMNGGTVQTQADSLKEALATRLAGANSCSYPPAHGVQMACGVLLN